MKKVCEWLKDYLPENYISGSSILCLVICKLDTDYKRMAQAQHICNQNIHIENGESIDNENVNDNEQDKTLYEDSTRLPVEEGDEEGNEGKDDLQPFKSYSMMSKKRFNEIVNMMSMFIDNQDKIREATHLLKQIMRFDPSAKQYTKENGMARRNRYRERALVEGKSFYEISGIKQSYHKRKAKKEKDNLEEQK